MNAKYFCKTPNNIAYTVEEVSAKSKSTDPSSSIDLKLALPHPVKTPIKDSDLIEMQKDFAENKRLLTVHVINWLDDDLSMYGLYNSLEELMEATC